MILRIILRASSFFVCFFFLLIIFSRIPPKADGGWRVEVDINIRASAFTLVVYLCVCLCAFNETVTTTYNFVFHVAGFCDQEWMEHESAGSMLMMKLHSCADFRKGTSSLRPLSVQEQQLLRPLRRGVSYLFRTFLSRRRGVIWCSRLFHGFDAQLERQSQNYDVSHATNNTRVTTTLVALQLRTAFF